VAATINPLEAIDDAQTADELGEAITALVIAMHEGGPTPEQVEAHAEHSARRLLLTTLVDLHPDA
jgi:hypothetical protein